MGKRYNEDVDTFSFGAVLYEIAVRDIPYGDEIAEFKKRKLRGIPKKLMGEVASGARKPVLDRRRLECRKYGVGGVFKNRRSFTICNALFWMRLIVLRLLPTVVKHCVKFEPGQRPTMQDVVRRLEKIIEEAETEPIGPRRRMSGPTVQERRRTSGPTVQERRTGSGAVLETGESNSLSSPWRASPKVSTAMETFISRIEDQEPRAKLEELCKHATADLGAEATEPLSGVYNPARLFYFLCSAEMDVEDARTQIVLNFNARMEFNIDAKRELIVKEDLSLNTLPRMLEYVGYQPYNPCVGRAKDGQTITYQNFGNKCDFEGLRKAFTIDEYIDCRYKEESVEIGRQKHGALNTEREYALYVPVIAVNSSFRPSSNSSRSRAYKLTQASDECD